MPNFRLPVRVCVGLIALTLVAGCGGGASQGSASNTGGGGTGGGGTQTSTPISVSIGPVNPATMIGGATQPFTATVANDSANAGVTWTVNGGGAFSAAVTMSGISTTYTAAIPVTSTSAVLTATSKTDTTKSASVTVALTPISVNPISPASFSMGAGSTQSFTDTVTNDSSNSGVSWSIGTGAGTLTASSSTGVTYNAPATVLSSTTKVTLTATSIKDPTKWASATITLNPIVVAVVPTNPPSMSGGATQAFAATLANDGTNAGVNWSVVGGGSFSANSTLSGAPTIYTAPGLISAGSVTVTATSRTDPTKSASVTVALMPVTLTLASASSITLDGDGAQSMSIGASITGDSTASGATFVVTGAGGTMSASPVSGNTPSSTYTAPVVAAATASTVTVTSVRDPTRFQTVAVTLNPPMSFTTPLGALAVATGGAAYPSTPIVVAGGTGAKTFSIGSGSLPAGLTMSAAGVISGTPTGSPGTSNFTVHAVDQSSSPASINGAFSITVSALPLTWTVPSAGAYTYPVGTAITPIPLITTGGTGNITYSISSGTLPLGLQIVGSQITGTPNEPTVAAGNTITLLATDSATPTPATATLPGFTLIASPVQLVIKSSSLPQGTVGIPYSYQLNYSGGTGVVNWSLWAGSLAGTGLTLSSSGLLSGTPTIPETGLSLTFLAKDSATNQQQTQTVPLLLNIINAITITTPSPLPAATLNLVYNQTLVASGGSGSGYIWSVTAGASSLAALNLSMSSGGVITGTPTATGSASFTVQVKDSANNSTSGSFTINTSNVLALPTPNPTSLGSATINLLYAGSINAGGGHAGYTWTVNGNTVPTNGTSIALSDGLSVSDSGGGFTLSISGTPTATGTISFTVAVKDSTAAIAGPLTYTINVSNFYTVNGQVNSQVGCVTGGLSGVSVSINTTPVQNTSTTANGSFSFSNVPNGTYLITPTIPGSSVAFYPATETVVVNSNNLSAASFTATLGYSVSGTVAYTGSQAGQIYLTLNPTGNCGGRSPGTSISAPGPFTIRGVPPGNYNLQAFLDNVGNGVPNAANPVGTTNNISPTTSNIAGVSVTLNDPAPVTLSTAPTLKMVSGFNTGAMAQYKPIINSSGVETAEYYTFQWSTSPTFATIAGSKRFPASGTHSNVWFLHSLTNGSVFYFRAYGTSGGTNVGPYSPVIGPVTITAPVGGNTVAGSVSFATAATGPLYVGFYDQGSGAYYGQYVASPVSAQPFTVQVPSGSDYLFLGIVDQNNDGAIDAGDITNTGNGTSQPVTVISGATSNQNLTLPSANGIASVTTLNAESIAPGGNTANYNINFEVNGLIKQPVAAALVSGPNLITPVDIAICGGPGSSCTQGFQITFNLYGTSPSVGDSYTFNVTYSDGTTGTLTAAVTAVLNAFAASLSPQTGNGVSLTPTFTWTDPLNAGNYTYQFFMDDSNGNAIWQIPANNATSDGFASSITSIVWGTDPTGGGSDPTVSALTLGTTYSWQITVQDANGNAAVTQVQYQP